MSRLQLVRRTMQDGSRSVAAVENPNERPYTEVVGSDAPVLLGSEGLIRLAVQLRAAGFKSVDVTLADWTFQVVRDDDLSDAIIGGLNSTDLGEVETFASTDLDGLVLLAVVLARSQPVQSQIRITQNGSLTVPDESAELVVADLRRALGDS